MVEPGHKLRRVRNRCAQMTGARSRNECSVQAVAATMEPRASPRENSVWVDDSGVLSRHQSDQGRPGFTLSTADACALRYVCHHVIHLLDCLNHPSFYQVGTINHQEKAPGCVISQSAESAVAPCSASAAVRSASLRAARASASARAAAISDSLRISIDQPVNFAARRTFCASLPIASDA